jgi:hypothetical protein
LADDFNRIMVHALAEHLRSKISGIGSVLEEWPTANMALVYPAISISTSECPLVPACVGREIVGVLDDDTHLAEVLHDVGQFEFKLQIDLWERTKPQRSALVAEFIDAFNKDVIPAGLRLKLSSYHNQYATLAMVGMSLNDTGRGSQIQEWRATIQVEGNCTAIRETAQPLIEEPILYLQEISTGYVNAT